MNPTHTGNEGLRDNGGKLILSLLLRNSLLSGTVSVGVSATKIPTTPLSQRKSIIIVNISSNIVYIGDSTVTTANGFPLYPRDSLRIDIEDSIDVYGIAGSASEVRILEGA